MVPNDTDASIGMEYFCFEGDDLWSMPDEQLVEFATREIQQLGLARADKVKFGFAVRVHKAYPIYDAEYAERLETIRRWLEGIPNLIQVGRNGLHRYNNSDHSMLTAMRACRQHPARHPPRHLGCQRRERVSRGARRARAALQGRTRDPGDGAAARFGAVGRRDVPPRTVVRGHRFGGGTDAGRGACGRVKGRRQYR